MSDKIILTLFGGTGDLAKRKIVPALKKLLDKEVLEEGSVLIGISRKNFTDEEYRDFLLSEFDEKDKEIFRKLNIKYFRGDFSKPESVQGLKELIVSFETSPGGIKNKLFYLSTSYKIFPGIVKYIKDSGLNKSQEGFTRVIFEKPFGESQRSSEKLDSIIHDVFPESEVYRIDHYLAKETVMNINVLKFSNPVIYSLLNKNCVECIEIKVNESLGVGNRLGYYHETGALKDMIQNHLLQVLALLLMRKPETLDSQGIHDKKIEVLRSLEPLDFEKQLFGQYRSYSEEVLKLGLEKRQTETFARVVLKSNHPDWIGVPLILQTGKKLPERFGEIKIKFKANQGNSDKQNELIISLYPKQNISLILNVKVPDSQKTVPASFEFSHEKEFGPNTSEEYATLLEESVKGDKTLFTRSDEINESWRIIEDIEKIRDKIKFVIYEDGEVPE